MQKEMNSHALQKYGEGEKKTDRAFLRLLLNWLDATSGKNVS
jgi:hypothetical protein